MAELNVDTLTHVGSDTPAGRFFREFWLPIAKSSEFVADGPPVRLMALGERLLGFRDSQGRVGIIDHRCPHRCASLFFGRNEEGGIRCAYHGWKFDVDGNCLDMPNVPPEQSFAPRIKARAFRAQERHGLVWAYLGARPVPPPLPTIGILNTVNEELDVQMWMRECNWLQAFEGDMDPSHLAFLHHGANRPEQLEGDFVGQWLTTGRAVKTKVADTIWGTMEGHFRPGAPNPDYWHFTQFLFPFWTMPGQDSIKDEFTIVRAWLPIDDTHAMNFQISRKVENAGRPGFFARPLGKMPGVLVKMSDLLLPNGTGWFDRWRLRPSAENEYLIDREMQRHDSYTGIAGIQIQDKAITESMGPIVDRSFEHLTPADLMIARTRRRLLSAIAAHETSGEVPAVLDKPELYLGAVAGGAKLPHPDHDWLELYRDETADRRVDGRNILIESAN